ncbi:MAG: hypothetical protein HQL02_04320 [Nitrospirae bacterium]|nr:hypothetical protein [Nitrospirota bacterium]
MKEIMMVLQTMDMNHPRARRCIEQLKKTDLSLAELFIVDSVYGEGVSRGGYLEGFRRLAQGRPLVLLSDDVFIEDVCWLTRLRDVAVDSDVLVVGCRHCFDGPGGTISVDIAGAIVGHGGVIEKVAGLPAGEGALAYVPLVQGGVVFVAEPERVSFDVDYQGSLCEADVCMQAWKMGKKVATSLNLSVRRMMPPEETNNHDDKERFDRKWHDFTNGHLYNVQELKWLQRH